MKLSILFLFIAATAIASQKCSESQEDCESITSEYEKYRECMERRTKRSANCYDSCDDCDCTECSQSSCSSCTSCCNDCCQSKPCSTYSCCHKTCRAECKSNACRTSCKRRCQDSPSSYTDGSYSAPVVTDTKSGSHHNITTVIHLNNMINNTNVINLPINVNHTVLNNITNEQSQRGGSGGYFYDYNNPSQERCCMTIGPKQCVSQSSYPFARCFHLRKKACGSICTAPVVHYQTHEICDNDVNTQQPCHQQMVFIPQPQPRCAYQSTWPYVTCGNQQSQSCEGCYSHYIKREDVTKCSNFCYDDGYGTGPYYRQAPFYRPGYAHVPSCYQTGTCGYENYGYEDNPGPMNYPPQSYPFSIQDCENCTFPAELQGSTVTIEQPNYKNLDSRLQWSNISNRMIKVDVKPGRPQRDYAQIKIQPTETSTIGGTTNVDSNSSVTTVQV